MTSITVTMKDGTVREFPHKGRPGGSYTKKLKLEVGFVVIIDEYGDQTVIPAADVKEVKTNETGSRY